MGIISDYLSQGADSIAGSYKEGGLPKAMGTAVRTMAGAIPAASAAYRGTQESLGEAARPIASAVMEPAFRAAEGLLGAQAGGLAPAPSPSPAPMPAAPGPILAAIPASGTIRGSSVAAPGEFGAEPSSATAAGNMPQRNVSLISAAQRAEQLQRAYAPTVYAAEPSSTPSLMREQPTGPTSADVMRSLNDGSWEGIINAKTMAKRIDADRAAAVAASGAQAGLINAQTGQVGAQSGRISALANAANAQTNAMKEQAQAGLIGEQVKNAQYEQKKRAQIDALTREMADPATTPERRREIERTLVTVHGRNPTQPQVHASPIYDAMGQKVGENLYERQQDGSWKNVTPKPSIHEDPRAQSIKADLAAGRIKDTDARQRLQAIGYQ